jgi:hypothetical protein
VQCNCSNHTTLDQQGIHITSVCGTDAAPSIIHDKLVHTLNQFIRFAGHRTTIEPKGCFSLYSDTNARPDISVQSYSTSQEKTLIDVSLTSPITSDNSGKLILKTGTPISSTSIKSHAASLRFKDKQNKYKKIIDQAIIKDNLAGNFHSNYKVLPFIFQTSGLIHHEAISYISDLAELASKDTSVPKENLKTYFLKRLNICLVTSIADAMLYKFHKLATTSSAGNNPFILSQVEQNLYSALSVAREENPSILYTN